MCWAWKISPNKSSVWNIIQPKNILAVLCPWLLLRFLGWVLSDSKKIDESQFWASSGPFFLSKAIFGGNFLGVKPDGSLDEVEGWIPVPLPL